MDFILFLIFAGIIFYFSQIKPRLEQQRAEEADTAKPAKKMRSKLVAASTHQPVKQQEKRVHRPSDPVLLGIEITASQQRRLGKNDPSVLAAQRAKQLHQAQQADSSFFEHMTSQVEHVFKQANEAPKHQSAASRSKSKPVLDKLFDNLFSK